MRKNIIKIMAAVCCILVSAGMAKTPTYALDYWGWDDTYWDDIDSDYTYEEPEEEVKTENGKLLYEYTSWELSSCAIAKGESRDFTLQLWNMTDWSSYPYEEVAPSKIKWSIDGKAAKITSKSKDKMTATVKAKKVGTVTLSVTYTYEFSDKIYRYTSTATVDVVNPKLSEKEVGINLHNGTSTTIYIENTSSYSDIVCETNDERLTAYSYYSWWENKTCVVLNCEEKGSYKATVTIDGKKFKLPVNVFSAYFKRNTKSIDTFMDKDWHDGYTMLSLYKGEKETLKVKGLKKNTKIKWSSSDKNVATVSKSGQVTGKGDGYCTITASFKGGKISYEVGVASETAIKAVHYAIEHFGSEYSQDHRMEEGKYDCSSYVFRSYKDAGAILGGDKSYAPTAADLAKWCEKKGYTLWEGTVDISKFLPGDIIFETGENNGRYKGIYHVDLYVGNRTTLTVERTKSFWDSMSEVIVARPAPSEPSLSLKSEKKINTLTWSRDLGATGYDIYRSTSEKGTYTKIATVKKDTKVTYEDKDVKKGTTYYYKVRAYFKDGDHESWGKYSKIKSIKTK